MKIDYELSKYDYLDFNMNYMSNLKTGKKVFIAQRYITPIVFFIVALIMTKATSIPQGDSFKGAALCYVLWAIFYPRYFNWASSKRILKMLDENGSEGMMGDHSLTLTERSIINSTPRGDSRTDWKNIKKIIETQKHIFIFISAESAYILPARVFKDENEKKKFTTNLNYMVDKANHRKNTK